MDQTLRRWQLRHRTAHAHSVVDAAIGAFADVEGYRRYLAANYRFRTPIERSLERFAWPEAMGGWRPRQVSAALEQDLLDMGAAVPQFDDAVPALPDDALMGTLYVLEGSMLGAQVLLKRAWQLGLSETHGARLLAGLERARRG